MIMIIQILVAVVVGGMIGYTLLLFIVNSFLN